MSFSIRKKVLFFLFKIINSLTNLLNKEEHYMSGDLLLLALCYEIQVITGHLYLLSVPS